MLKILTEISIPSEFVGLWFLKPLDLFQFSLVGSIHIKGCPLDGPELSKI